jgi:hypothetical protein
MIASLLADGDEIALNAAKELTRQAEEDRVI